MKKNKLLISFLLMIVLSLGLVFGVVLADNDPSLEIKPAKITVQPGENVTYELVLKNIEKLSSMNFRLQPVGLENATGQETEGLKTVLKADMVSFDGRTFFISGIKPGDEADIDEMVIGTVTYTAQTDATEAKVCVNDKDIYCESNGEDITDRLSYPANGEGTEVEIKAEHIHDFAGSKTYDSDAKEHWKVCECGVADTEHKETHTFVKGEEVQGVITYTCSVCGYEVESPAPVIEEETQQQTWNKDLESDLVIISKAEVDTFVAVKVDGQVVAPENYKVESGSTKITFYKAFLDTLGEGEHHIEIESTIGTASTTVTIEGSTPQPEELQKIRVAGAGRVQTSLEAAKELLAIKGQHDNIIVANAFKFPDALAGGYLAQVTNAPILLVNEADTTTTAAILTHISTNSKADATVYILGGNAAVSEDFEAGIASIGRTAIRLGGAGRYDTNILILEECARQGGDMSSLMFCKGTDFADSLSASAVNRPIFLVNPEGTLTENQRGYLYDIRADVAQLYVIGGQSALSDAVIAPIEGIIGETATRVAGENRYETSQEIGKQLIGSFDKVVLAYAFESADGLSAGPLAAAAGAPIQLVNSDAKAAEGYKDSVKAVYVMGGEARIPKTAVDDVFGSGSWK